MSTLSTFSLPKRLVFFFIWLFMLVLAKTLRIGNNETAHRFLCGEIFKQNNGDASFLLFWHNDLLLIFLIFITYKKNFPPITVLVSSNKSADIFAALLEKFGYSIVRGSANTKSLQALKGMHTAIKKKHVIAYAADGPTGPIYKFKPGAVFLSHKYKLPIDLIHAKPARMITFSTWDSLKLPLPFTKVRFDSIKVMASEFESDNGKTLSKEELSQSVSKLHEKMHLISDNLRSN